MLTGIRQKLLAIIISIVFIVLGAQTYLQMTLQQQAFDLELQKRTLLMQENLHHRALSLSETLKNLMTEYIAAYKFFELNNTALQTASETQELAKIIVVDKNKQVYIDTSQPSYSGLYQADPEISQSDLNTTRHQFYVLFNHPVRQVQLENTQGLEYKIPIVLGQETWGHIILIFSLEDLNKKIAETTASHHLKLKTLNIDILVITFSLLFFAYIFSFQITKRLMAPVLTLARHTKELANGNFSSAKSIPTDRKDEIGLLSQNFVDMAENLEKSLEALEHSNQTLEQKVEERTHKLNLNNAALKQALAELEDSQQQLIHAEKMAALGQLIAGIAHEINTPLGAIQASAGNNTKSFKAFEQNLPAFIKEVPQKDKELLDALLKCTLRKVENGVIYSTREERQQKKDILAFLESQRIPKADMLSDYLLDMIVTEDLPDIIDLLRSEHVMTIIKQAHNLSALARNNQTILTAINKASKVVFSLKNFSHHDSSGKKILSNINQGIQTVLVLYQNFLKQGCTVIEDFGELPDILCYPDELNQVWTNLIHNALYAMQNVGTLTIETHCENGQIIVRLTDSGMGIPDEIQDKVFNSFFTTKPAGEGSGLGLGICKRIIDKHEGEISLSSRPGKTTFTVILPVLSN